jgi:ATP/maltotriose-dependent transcriptional regulator MalT
MDPIHGLIQSLKDTRGDIRAQAALTAEFLVMALPKHEHESIHAAVDAAAVLRWFDADLLAKVLEISDQDAQQRFATLKTFSFVERYCRGKNKLHNLHEATRLGWRSKMARESLERFRGLSSRASLCFANQATPAGRIREAGSRVVSE